VLSVNGFNVLSRNLTVSYCIIDAKAYSGEDSTGRLNPAKGLRRDAMMIEKNRDGGFEFLDTAKYKPRRRAALARLVPAITPPHGCSNSPSPANFAGIQNR
jgi:hypothetical protein